jgi:hypothetical protein
MEVEDVLDEPEVIVPTTTMKQGFQADRENKAMVQLRNNLRYLGRKKPRKFYRDEFIDNYIEDLSNAYMSLTDYLTTYSIPLLQSIDFHTFCNFCYLYSDKSK